MDPIKRAYRQWVNRARKAFTKAAYDIGAEMQKKYVECVDAFYDDWPKHEIDSAYYRTYSTYLGNSISYDIGEKKSGTFSLNPAEGDDGEVTTFTMRVVLHLDPSYLGNPYHDPVDYVFGRTFVLGIHGNLANPVMKQPPYVMFNEWFEKYKKSIGPAKIVGMVRGAM